MIFNLSGRSAVDFPTRHLFSYPLPPAVFAGQICISHGRDSTSHYNMWRLSFWFVLFTLVFC
ncbi:MAG: hypothetical protein CL936_02570 [Deltaproteobacteria bacterium]|nr:hypothetical protein [Deltaproteobacteria bacterium]